MKEEPCEVILIAGFLGAGKTTFLRRLLSWPGQLQGTVVLVNEFGQIGIDGELLEGYATPVVELANGCICCTLQGDMIRSLEMMLTQFHPKRLLVEATGVADPLDVLKAFQQPQFRGKFGAIKLVTVVDADYWEGREVFGPLFYNQIKMADLVLLNKIDLLAPEKVKDYLTEISEVAPKAAVVPTCQCNVDAGMIWSLAGGPVEEPTTMYLADLLPPDLPPGLGPGRAPVIARPRSHEHEHEHEHEHGAAHRRVGFIHFAFEAATPFREDCFRQWLAAVPVELYRIKGHVLLPDKRVFINHVGGKTEWTAALGDGGTKLAFVGWQIDRHQVISQLEACLERQS